MEGEAARFIIQGTEMSISVAKDAAKSLVQVIAFFRAMAEKEKLFGEVSQKGMLKTGEQLSIIPVSGDRMQDFILKAKEYGLPYHSVAVPENNMFDIMIKRADMDKFNAIIERIGIVRNDVPVQDFTVEDVRKSVRDKLENLAGAEKGAGRMEKSRAQEMGADLREPMRKEL